MLFLYDSKYQAATTIKKPGVSSNCTDVEKYIKENCVVNGNRPCN